MRQRRRLMPELGSMPLDRDTLIRQKMDSVMRLTSEADELRQLIAQLEARIAEERRYHLSIAPMNTKPLRQGPA
jgi:hypothetical protein